MKSKNRAYLLILFSFMISLIGCSEKQDEKVLDNLLNETEEHIYLRVAVQELFVLDCCPGIFYPDFLKSSSAGKKIVWGMSEDEIKGMTDTLRPMYPGFIQQWESMISINDERLPDIDRQAKAIIDPFSATGEILEYAGHPKMNWYIIRSCGPDKDKDLPIESLDLRPFWAYSSYKGLGEPLTCYQYDPTNGTLSSGDLIFWRDARYGSDLAIRHFPPFVKKYERPEFHLWDLIY